MGVYEGRGQLSKSVKNLMLKWTEVRSHWSDASSREFEKTFITPLEMSARSAASAMDHMAVILQQVRRDCE